MSIITSIMFAVKSYNRCRLSHRFLQYFCETQVNPTLRLRHIKLSVASQHDLKADSTVLSTKSQSPVNKYMWRTSTCGELGINNVGESVKLCGWVEFRRLTKFIVLRDAYGITQLYIPEDRKDLHDLIEDLPFESVLCVTGKVQERPGTNKNPEMKTGDIEISIETLEVLNRAHKILPLYNKEHNKSNENLQMQYRYIALRNQRLQRNLRFRSDFIHSIREFMIKECHFVDIETPTLFKNTPGGAQEFVVPTQQPGLFYSLVQSPQQLKQLLMVGGCDRYFQVARCYRDETGRYDKQPEFTQLDIEMSFVDCSGIITLVEDLLEHCWPAEIGSISTPFQRMTYNEAMKLYGTDKPDLTIPYQLRDLTKMIDAAIIKEEFKLSSDDDNTVYGLTIPKTAKFLRNKLKEQLNTVRKEYYPNVKLLIAKTPLTVQKNKQTLSSHLMSDEIRKVLDIKTDDVIFVAVGKEEEVQELLGTLRIKLVNAVEESGITIRTPGFKFLWVTDFPLFAVDSKTGTLQSNHHPFTQPNPEDMHYFSTQPHLVRGLHYDLVLNGLEIGGGSIRIHDSKLQQQILEMLNIPHNNMYYMLHALECGAPPHGGIALGLDRLTSLLCGEKSIKSVIAFPKTIEGRDLMTNAPSPISDEEKQLYHLCDKSKE